MNVLDLFSGIGGFSLGLERAGMRTVAFCEREPFACGLLAQHWPGVPIHNDVTTRPFHPGEADVISAGFPCQDISFAGDGAGLAGERSGLYRHVIRALCLVRPKFALLENVAALLSRGLDVVLGDMAEVGYDAEWHCIPASAVGAPHRRDRIWIIADPRGEQHESRRAPFSGAISEELLKGHPDAAGERRGEAGQFRHAEPPQRFASVCEEMADASRTDVQGFVTGRIDQEERGGSIQRQTRSCRDGLGWWAAEPDVGRVAHGVPARVDRLKGLGNAVVPQIPEIIGRAIMKTAQSRAESER